MHESTLQVNAGPSTRPAHIRPLTGLRFFAAMLVVFFHAGLPSIHRPLWFRSIIESGFVGVLLFFVLSGFILTYNYLDAQGRFATTAREFWVARIARIYPTYLLGLVLFFPYAFSSNHAGVVKQLIQVVAPLLLVQSWLPDFAREWNSPGWTLSVEAFFYALFPVFVAYVGQFRREIVYYMVVSTWLLFCLLQQLSLHYWQGGDQPFVTDPALHLPEFLLGMAVARLFLYRRAAPSGNRRRRHMPPPGITSLVAAALIAIVLSQTGRFPAYLPMNDILLPLFALLVYDLAFNRGIVAWFLSLPLLTFLGEASYAIYIVHWPIMFFMHTLSKHSHHLLNQDSRSYFLLYLCVVLAVSSAAFVYVEQPGRRAIKRYFARRYPARRAVPGIAESRRIADDDPSAGLDAKAEGVAPPAVERL